MSDVGSGTAIQAHVRHSSRIEESGPSGSMSLSPSSFRREPAELFGIERLAGERRLMRQQCRPRTPVDKAKPRRYTFSMQVLTGRIVNGRVELQGAAPDEGRLVTVLVTDDERSFDVSEEEKEALLKSIAEADRGDLVPAAEVLAKLRQRQ